MSSRPKRSITDKPKHHQSKKKLDFIVPAEAKVFYPSVEEFQNPLRYINKIRPVAENTGICKIVPPQNWQFPFSLNIDKMKFSARLQKLNQLDGKTRLKLNFLDQLSQFWELQGTHLNIPEVQNRQLDLYDLYKLSRKHFSKMNEDTFINITKHMGLEPKDSVVSVVKQTFEEFIQPYIVFNELCELRSDNLSCKSDSKSDIEVISLTDTEETNCRTDSNIEIISLTDSSDDEPACPNPELKQHVVLKEEVVTTKPRVYRELKRLQFLGPGPKMNSSNTAKRRRCNKTVSYLYEDSFEFTCCSCTKPGDESSILTCNGCNDKYHFSCIKPSLQSRPKGNWNCLNCTTMSISKPTDDFGFEQAKEEYTLNEFCEMAGEFKEDHFLVPLSLVSKSQVEQEYWKLVSDINSDVVVKYGADLHAVDNGSGFPTPACSKLQAGDVEYVNSGWNLNNLPVLKNSLLRYINSNVSGMKIPWLYVGMCFATFCWHNEDHWLCSINYVHWGDTKTWYGVPGKDAEAFEKTMKAELPELFEAQPDILHQLVTVMNPNILMKANVPVYRLDQNQGEFVITFPRAYHMGFNQGFNFAEAVNFAPAEWFTTGRECVLNYAQLKRFNVFSHDELLCSIASVNTLNPVLASTIHSDLLYVIAKEEKLRGNLREDGVTTLEKAELEFVPDDKRHCEVCKTTCYISALACTCNDEVVVCLDHYKDLCKCPTSKQVIKYRYTIDELQQLLANVDSVLENYSKWLCDVENSLNLNSCISNKHLKNLLIEAEFRDYPECSLYKTLRRVVNENKLFNII